MPTPYQQQTTQEPLRLAAFHHTDNLTTCHLRLYNTVLVNSPIVFLRIA